MSRFFLSLLVLFTSGLFALAQKTEISNDRLEIIRLSEHTFQHITFLETETFGKVSCNGLIVVSEEEALVLDSPAQEADAELLIQWIQEELDLQVVGVIATHFHEDCLGGLEAFHRLEIPSYGSRLTRSLAEKQGSSIPKLGFDRLLSFKLGDLEVRTQFFGKGHTVDNTVCFIEKDQVLFGGCLVKELNASKGNLADADTLSWTSTIESILEYYPMVQVVVPGHGKTGGKELLEYTAKLFR
ncbi:MAG: subclass B1 metallo-beta-lactamase [Bacteroidota bacterium]